MSVSPILICIWDYLSAHMLQSSSHALINLVSSLSSFLESNDVTVYFDVITLYPQEFIILY